MARFNDTWMETLLSKNDIVSLVSEYVPLHAKGRKLWGLCPFHNEKTPSFSVSEDKQMYYCFGCGAGGGIVQFVMDMERLPYMETIQFLAQRAGMEMPDEVDDAAMQRERAHKERLYAACKAAAQFFYQQLLGEQGLPARQYLARRGLEADIVQRFGIGYAPDSWDSLLCNLKAEGFSEVELVDAGLLIKHANTGRVYDAYRNRVVFPIIGANARVLGFGARTLGDDLPKYINTGETPIYSKRRNLYAVNLLKKQKTAEAIMVEGYMDVVSLHAAGIQNAVASLGTALTQQQAHLLKRYVQHVYIAYDGDAAGQNATLRGMEILAKEGLQVRVVELPLGSDPDDFVRQHGKEAFEQLKDQAQTLNAFKLKCLGAQYDLSTEDGRQDYAFVGCSFIASLQPVEQERYYLALSRATGLSLETLKEQGARSRKNVSSFEGSVPRRGLGTRPRREEGPSERERMELMLLQSMLQSEEGANAVLHCDAAMDTLFSEQSLREFAKGVSDAYAQGKRPDVALLLSTLTPAQSQLVASVSNLEEMEGNIARFAEDCIKRIRLMDIETQMQALRDEMAHEAITIEDKLRIMQRLRELETNHRMMK